MLKMKPVWIDPESGYRYCCAVFHDKEYREAEVDVEVQKDVKGCYIDTEHVRFRTLPEITVDCSTCKGSYEQMEDINAACPRLLLA